MTKTKSKREKEKGKGKSSHFLFFCYFHVVSFLSKLSPNHDDYNQKSHFLFLHLYPFLSLSFCQSCLTRCFPLQSKKYKKIRKINWQFQCYSLNKISIVAFAIWDLINSQHCKFSHYYNSFYQPLPFVFFLISITIVDFFSPKNCGSTSQKRIAISNDLDCNSSVHRLNFHAENKKNTLLKKN